METTWTRRIAIVAVLTAMAAQPAHAHSGVLIGFVSSERKMAVQLSVDGAIRRLGDAACQSVFADFSLPTPDAHRLTAVRFVDDRDAALCQNGSSVLAFTFPGSNVVHICGRRFLEMVRTSRTLAEVVIIHEFLHVLGLGENPPSSDAITVRVAARCAP
jgi:hypothetical protein